MTAPEPRDPALGTTRTSLPIMLLRAREAVMARFRPMLHEIGVTEQQWRVLRVLDEGGELDVSTVAHRAAILPPSLTGTGRDLILGAAPDSAMIYAEISRLYGMERLDALMAEIDALIDTLQDEPEGN